VSCSRNRVSISPRVSRTPSIQAYPVGCLGEGCRPKIWQGVVKCQIYLTRGCQMSFLGEIFTFDKGASNIFDKGASNVVFGWNFIFDKGASNIFDKGASNVVLVWNLHIFKHPKIWQGVVKCCFWVRFDKGASNVKYIWQGGVKCQIYLTRGCQMSFLADIWQGGVKCQIHLTRGCQMLVCPLFRF